MELLRHGRDVYGRQVLEGISWDLIPYFVALGGAIILVHALYARFFSPQKKKPKRDG